MHTVKVLGVGAGAVLAAGFVRGTDWYKGETSSTGPSLLARAAELAAGGAVVFLGVKYLIH